MPPIFAFISCVGMSAQLNPGVCTICLVHYLPHIIEHMLMHSHIHAQYMRDKKKNARIHWDNKANTT